MSNYQDSLTTIKAMLDDPAAFRGGAPVWRSVDEFHKYLESNGYKLTSAEQMGPKNRLNGQQLIYQGPNNVIVKIKTQGYNDNGPPQRVGVATMSIEATDGKGTGWGNAIFKVDGNGRILPKSITAVNEEVVRLPADHPARKEGQTWGVKNPRDGSIRAFTKFELIQGGGGEKNPVPVDKQKWADASHLNLPKDFNPRGADDLVRRVLGVRRPAPAPKQAPAKPPVLVTNPPKPDPTNASTQPTRGGGNAHTGSPVKPVTEHAPKPTPKTNAVKLALSGFNWIIQGINDHIQQGRIEEQMRKLRPTIEQTLNDDPGLGVLIVITYYQRQKMGAENESPLEHTKSFQHIKYEYGRTEEEAQQKFINAPPQISPAGAGQPVIQKQWIPPQRSPKAEDIPTPFSASGLATFVPGLEELVSVKFSHAAGFDDKVKSVISVGGKHARFIIMFPPNEVKYFWNGNWRSEVVEQSLVRPGQIVDPEQSVYYVPTIDLDSWANPYDASAAMVYPADDYTKSLFEPKGRIDDGGLLGRYSMNLVRFVKPHKIRLLKDFNAIELPL